MTVELIAGVVYALAYERINSQGTGSLPHLAPLCTDPALALARCRGRLRCGEPEAQ
jgi:hypothetical protein